jgi:hypothetical protein
MIHYVLKSFVYFGIIKGRIASNCIWFSILWANEQKKYQNKVNSSLNPKIAFEFAVVIAAISSAERP